MKEIREVEFWKQNDEMSGECSCCCYHVTVEETVEFSYCPRCGAFMRRDDKEESLMMNFKLIGKIKIRDHAVAITQPKSDSYAWIPVYEYDGKRYIKKFDKHDEYLFDIDDFYKNEYGIRYKEKHRPKVITRQMTFSKFYTNMYDELPEIE